MYNYIAKELFWKNIISPTVAAVFSKLQKCWAANNSDELSRTILSAKSRSGREISWASLWIRSPWSGWICLRVKSITITKRNGASVSSCKPYTYTSFFCVARDWSFYILTILTFSSFFIFPLLGIFNAISIEQYFSFICTLYSTCVHCEMHMYYAVKIPVLLFF